jgi:hypothetical protein
MKGLKPLIIVIVLTALLNLFYTSGTPIVPGWIITWEGLKKAILLVARIIMLIAGTFLLTYTTSPIALTDGLEILLNPLKKIKVPVHEMSMMMSMALRFIPTLTEETDKIMSAQKARGADFETGSLLQRARALLPILVPSFCVVVPPGGRACHCHGKPLLSRRRGQDEDENAEIRKTRPVGAAAGRGVPGRSYCTEKVWTVMLCAILP